MNGSLPGVVEEIDRGSIESAWLRNLLDLVTEATSQVLATTTGSNALEARCVRLGSDHLPLYQLTTKMRLSGDINGQVAISMDERLARELVSRIAWARPEDLKIEDVKDGLGELINQISGCVMTMLSRQNQKIQMDLPGLGVDPKQPLCSSKKEDCFAVIFECLEHSLALQVCCW